jgi:Na+/H+-dicarboxylate symporter
MLKSLSVRVLLGLAAGLGLGIALTSVNTPEVARGVEIVEALGGLWLNALRMTVVPLVFSLLVVGIASVADAAATGKLAIRAILLFSLLILAAAVYGLLAASGLLAVWPVDAEGARSLISAAQTAEKVQAEAPTLGEWIRGLAPSNPIAAAAEDAILPLVVFSVFLGFAATRLPEDMKTPLVTFFRAVAEAMIVIVRWVLMAAPFGVFALAIGVGLRAGIGAVGVLAHYVAIVSLSLAGSVLIALAIGIVWGRVRPARFMKAASPVLAVALSTQSSLACLPLMVERTRDELGVPARITGLILPLAVAVFRFTSPVGNLAVALFVAHVYGVELGPMQYVTAVFVAFAISVGAVGLPGQVSFILSIAPICLAMGLPIELLPLLLAVEVIPDIFRTLGNVSADMSVTTILGRNQLEDVEDPLEPA